MSPSSTLELRKCALSLLILIELAAYIYFPAHASSKCKTVFIVKDALTQSANI